MTTSALGTSVAQLSLPEDEGREIKLLTAKEDRYGGVIVELEEAMEPNAFAASLKASMDHWRKQEKNCVWIQLPLRLSSLVDIAVQEGFRYHHAEPDYLMLACWLPSRPDTLPANASHRVGIGAFVINDHREVLVVQEKSGAFGGSGVWKFPTGVVDEGEDICDAAIREVKEETGIDAEFIEVLAFRQSHKGFCGKSDLLFVCMLKPLSSEIQKQDTEIEAAKWMPLDEYVNQPFIQKHGQFKQIADICLNKSNSHYSGFSLQSAKSNSGTTNIIYFNGHDMNRQSLD
uniref:Nudix hydrolase domain-containing protein n=1 Tax=Kalanchoe fedtschenkoi TaxID=63787 RepID=A0A7N0RJ12_KALFE